MPKLIEITEWANQVFEGQPFTKSRLQAWARSGRFSPPAQKIGGQWFVESGAVYKKRNLAPLNELKLAQIMIDDAKNASVGLDDIDPKVLEIMSYGTQTA